MGRMCGLSTVVTPAGASLTMYREIRSYANSIWDDNNTPKLCNRFCFVCFFVAFSEYFRTVAVFFLYGKYVAVRFSLLEGFFLPCNHGLHICVQSIDSRK